MQNGIIYLQSKDTDILNEFWFRLVQWPCYIKATLLSTIWNLNKI